eukprot:3274347-Rhodomonas_salina.1
MPLRTFSGVLLPVCHTCHGRVFTASEMRHLSGEVAQATYLEYVCNPHANPTRSRLCVSCLCRVCSPAEPSGARRQAATAPPTDLTAAERCENFQRRLETK